MGQHEQAERPWARNRGVDDEQMVSLYPDCGRSGGAHHQLDEGVAQGLDFVGSDETLTAAIDEAETRRMCPALLMATGQSFQLRSA